MIGKNVWTTFGRALRIGKITEKKIQNDWAFVRVNWIDDTDFEVDRQRVIKLRGYDKYSDWYRIDKVNFFNKDEIVNKINKL